MTRIVDFEKDYAYKHLTWDFTEDYNYLVDRIFTKKQRTAFVRYNDGEYWLAANNYFHWAGGFWQAHEDKQLLRHDMLQAMQRNDADVIFGIPSSQHKDASLWFQENIPSKNKTFATIFVNNNWERFREVIRNLQEPVVLICNEKWAHRNYPFKILDVVAIPNDVVSYYQTGKEEILWDIKTLTSKYVNVLFLFCAGPLSNVLIDYAWECNNNNRYIDIWSTLDEYIHGRPTRNYYHENKKTYNQIDTFN